jgi:dTDP-glucose 4,6-dehydratase
MLQAQSHMSGQPNPSFWNGKTVFVTGASGFAGGHLSENLVKLGANVRCFVRSEHNLPVYGPHVKTVLGDVQDYQSLIEGLKGVDVAFHLAAITVIPETRAKIFNTFATNSLGTLNFLMAAREAKPKKVVYVSTCHVYGKQDNVPLTEETSPHPIDIYSASKLAGESVALSFAEMYNMDISISRAFNHYGPRQRPEFLIPQVIYKLLKGKGKSIQMGNPEPTRDFCYVDDIVRGYMLLAEKGKSSNIYHFASGIERSVKDIVDTIVRASGSNPEVKWDPGARRVDIPRSVGDYSKARKELGWRPTVEFDDGVRKTLAWYRAHPELEQEVTG